MGLHHLAIAPNNHEHSPSVLKQSPLERAVRTAHQYVRQTAELEVFSNA